MKHVGATPGASPKDIVTAQFVRDQTRALVFSTLHNVPLVVGVGQTRIYAWRTLNLVGCILGLSNPTAGSSAIFDVNVDGTTIFTTQANRPSCAATSYSGTLAVPDILVVYAGSYFTVDCDQIGSTTPGKNANLSIIHY